MKLSAWRTAFKSFVDERVTIDSWLLEKPDTYDIAVGFLPPLRDMDFTRRDSGEVKLRATQDFIISQRHPSVSYNELPVDIIEGYYSTLAIAFVATYQDIDADLYELSFNQVEQPISITEISEDNNDWIVDIKWSLRIEVNVEPEIGAIIQPFDLRQITAHIWRDNLEDGLSDGVSDTALRRLDFTKIWNYTTVNGRSQQTL